MFKIQMQNLLEVRMMLTIYVNNEIYRIFKINVIFCMTSVYSTIGKLVQFYAIALRRIICVIECVSLSKEE